jgi:polyketide cyclase/dehydrase/lipid transport protein
MPDESTKPAGTRNYDQPMTDPTDPLVTATLQIDARPEVVYGLITDLPTLASLAEETVAMEWRKGSSVRPGAVFVGRNENSGRRWTTKCTVTDAEPGRVFAFDVRHTVFPVARWQYDIVAADGGCRVTESTWDRRPGWFAKLAGRVTGVTDRGAANTEHIRLTLQRLKQRAEAG